MEEEHTGPFPYKLGDVGYTETFNMPLNSRISTDYIKSNISLCVSTEF